MKAQKNKSFEALPSDQKAQIAQILLNNERKNIQSSEPNQIPSLKLKVNSTSSHLAVEFFRVSSDGQRDGYSLEAQKEKAEEYNKQHGLKSMRFWSVTESASKELDRKQFFEMVQFVSDHGIKNVIFDKIDRACRGLRAAVMIEDLVEAGVRFHFTRDNLIVDKNSSPGEKLRFYLGVVLAKHYIDNLKIEIRKGLDQRWKNGHWNGAAPIGYINLRDDNNQARVVVDEKIAPYIQEIFELYATGNYSYKALEKYLMDRKVVVPRTIREDVNGVPTIRRVEQPISHKCFEKLLTNPFYYGARRRNGAVTFTGKEKHEPLISKELFDRCQKIKGLRAEKHQLSNSKEIGKPLMNLLKCGECDHWVTGEVHKKPNGKIYVYYHCANQSCAQRRVNVRQEEIMGQLTKAFEPFSRFTPKATTVLIENLEGKLKELNLYANDKIQELAKKKEHVEARCKELEAMASEGKLSQPELEEVLRQKQKVMGETEVEIQDQLKVSQETLFAGLKIIELLRKAHEFMHLDGNELDKARLFKQVLSNPKLKSRNVEFHYRKPFDDLIELTAHRNWWTLSGSNRRPLTCHASALPTELRAPRKARI